MVTNILNSYVQQSRGAWTFRLPYIALKHIVNERDEILITMFKYFGLIAEERAINCRQRINLCGVLTFIVTRDRLEFKGPAGNSGQSPRKLYCNGLLWWIEAFFPLSIFVGYAIAYIVCRHLKRFILK